MSKTRMFQLEIRPLITAPFRPTFVWNPHTSKWQRYLLRRGKWFTAHMRIDDRRFVFTAGPGASTRRLMSFTDAKRGRAQFVRQGFATRITSVNVEQWPMLRGDLDFRKSTGDALQRVAARIGETIDVISGGRKLSEQQHLYDLYLKGIGNLAAVPNANAPHIRGIAADCYVNGLSLRTVLVRRGMVDEAARLGVRFPVASEPWHAEVSQVSR